MSGNWTRLEVHGSARRAAVVVPDDEPVAGLLPDLLGLLDEDRAAGAHPLALVTVLGEQVDPERSLAEQGVSQGSVLRVVRVDQAPPSPEVADVTDVVAGALAERADRWRPAWSVGVAAAVAGVAGWLSADAASAADMETPWLVAAVAVVAVLAAAVARLGARAAGVVLGSGAGGSVVGLAPMISVWWGVEVPGASTLVALVGAGVVVAVVVGLGLGHLGAGVGPAVGAVLACMAMLLAPAAGASGAVGVSALACVLVLGLLPGVAMTLSGLSGLDDRVVAGGRPARAAVRGAVDETYRALTSSVVATAAVAGATAWQLAGSDDRWAQVLAWVVAVLVALRARVLPLVPQRLALWAAALAVGLAWSTARVEVSGGLIALAAAGVVVLAAVVATVRLPEPVAARARRLASVLELFAVVATVPLLLAQLGVFAGLVETF